MALRLGTLKAYVALENDYSIDGVIVNILFIRINNRFRISKYFISSVGIGCGALSAISADDKII